ncbi:hypothetical protein GTQ34_07835 [Muricauda sp. JGD-17]|uniref:Uncharacterized protein n=1 Tax=Flagellimonas ochracea TaxID=2696472 RepID=A0A964WXH7_9FLAO|nr:hypothetical protein [Allomuricauda ochracea]NAY91823.1 hypothetical protein [Allomuricauda ochracea]
MLKAISLPIIASLLITFLLAPPVMSLFDKDLCAAIILSPEEEEKNNEKEAEKKLDEKDLFLSDYVESHKMVSKEKKINTTEYLFSLLDYNLDILVPPPRICS